MWYRKQKSCEDVLRNRCYNWLVQDHRIEIYFERVLIPNLFQLGPVIGQRHLQTFLLFMAIVVNYMAKFNAGVAIVAMTNAESSNPNFPVSPHIIIQVTKI